MRKVTKKNTLIAIFIIPIVAITISSAGILENQTSNRSSQKNGLATYTGYLAGERSYWYPVRSNDFPSSVTNNLVTLTFADGRTFIANKTLAESKHIELKATYTVYYNLTEPTVAIDIVKKDIAPYP